MANIATCGCPATQDAIRNGVTAEPGRCIGCGTPVQAYVLVSGMGDVFLKADNSWTRSRSEAERFYNVDAAFMRSAERNGRYVEKAPAEEGK